MKKYVSLLLLVTGLSCALFGAERKFVFHFISGTDAFYVPWKGNNVELGNVHKLIHQYKAKMDSAKIPVYVYGYCGKGGTLTTRTRRAKQMSNRVKSELIYAKDLKEMNFVTQNSPQCYSSEIPNAVVLHFVLPEPKAAVEKKLVSVQTTRKDSVPTQILAPAAQIQKISPMDSGKLLKPAVPQEPTEVMVEPHPMGLRKSSCDLALRTNLLHWLCATMNVGIEWKFQPRFSLVMDVDYAPWRWNEKKNFYRVFNVQPQLRYYPLASSRFYVGAESHFGQLNWKLSTKGHQGSFIGAGLVLGYQKELNQQFDLDMFIGAGYTRYHYDEYQTVDGFLYRSANGLTKNFWGIGAAGVSLIWKL